MLYEFFLKRKAKKKQKNESCDSKNNEKDKKKKSDRTWVDRLEEYDALLHK